MKNTVKIVYLIFTLLVCGCVIDKDEMELYNSISVYGGSVSSVPESDTSKLYWARELKLPVYTYGVGGGGFINTTTVPIPKQVNKSPLDKIAILWCSTNDMYRPVENEDMYSPETQNGGMRIAIEKLRTKNPQVIILIFGSLPCFPDWMRIEGISPVAPQVEGQMKVAEEYNIPYLCQINFFTMQDKTEMYIDSIHLTEKGYMHIRERQLEFIRSNIK